MPPRRCIMVLGKAPAPGRVKTRLTPPLEPEQAARLAGAMLLDTLRLAQCVAQAQVTFVHPPLDDEALVAELVPTGVRRLVDCGSDLGASMRRACEAGLAGGAHSVVLIGSDLPTLPAHLIDHAFSILERHERDVVLGPAVDGGYYLIGLSQQQPSLFDGIAWSTEHVLNQTMMQACEVGLRVHLLAPWRDIDMPDDVDWLARSLADGPSESAPATRAVLASWLHSCTQMGDVPRRDVRRSRTAVGW